MDIATIGTKMLKKRGLLPELDESEEINACSIHVPAKVNGEEQDWLLMFKNETHNHPTEIEPFGGAATCIGGCIRDPLSGRAYVHQAMRVTGGGDPRKTLAETLARKAPPAQAGADRGGGLFVLRQPDRPCHRPCRRALPRGLHCQAPGVRRGRRRGARQERCAASVPPRATSLSCSAAARAVTASAARPVRRRATI